MQTVVLETCTDIGAWKPRRVLVQCTSLGEALTAAAQGADGIIAKGSESGGRVGDESSFVLFQRLKQVLDLPIWVQGGIGLYTAGACIAGGAAGVVVDAQLALLEESSLDAETKAAITAMDGGETSVVAGHRLLVKPAFSSLDASADVDEIRRRLAADDPRERVLAAGQDAAFAADLAAQYRTANKLIRALRASIATSIATAQEEAPLRAFSTFASQHGVRYPIAQGPMTRVSDTPEFARAVADAGGLPFLALALLRGPDVRELLQETATRMEGRTWGVGILGFVPPELREEQIEVIREVRPPVALIAGGRPSQARPLEDLGIPTYLHVPSPGPARYVPQAGRPPLRVRRVRSAAATSAPAPASCCGSRRSSGLMQHDAPAELSLLFAGGIHDAVSGAMVSALTAPLARRGAKVGVLMGTAYLFTQEAVASGAIQQGFQDAALACDATVLLETAPGHSTRCADTEYVAAFKAERERLTQRRRCRSRRSGKRSKPSTWGACASLPRVSCARANASSRRTQHTQRREGMVMLGQVAALRSELTTIADLHREVSEGATQVLDAVDGAAVAAHPLRRHRHRGHGGDPAGRLRDRRVLVEHRARRRQHHARSRPTAGTPKSSTIRSRRTARGRPRSGAASSIP